MAQGQAARPGVTRVSNRQGACAGAGSPESVQLAWRWLGPTDIAGWLRLDASRCDSATGCEAVAEGGPCCEAVEATSRGVAVTNGMLALLSGFRLSPIFSTGVL